MYLRRIPRSIMLFALCGLALVLIAGCANNSTDTGGQTGDKPAANQADEVGVGQDEASEVGENDEGTGSGARQAVAISGSTFQPGNVTIKAGTTVVWTNEDSIDHQVHDDNDAFLSDIIGKDGTVEIAYRAPGTFTYHCHVHSNMTGTIVVE